MKKIFITMLVYFTTAFIFATTTNITDDKKNVEKKSQNIQVVAHSVINFTELAKKAAETKTKDITNIKTQVIPISKWHGQQISQEDLKKIKKKKESTTIPTPTTTPNTSVPKIIPPFIGPPLGPVDTQNDFMAMPDGPDIYGYMRIPPDTMGTAGPNHLMIVLNSHVRVQNKSGGNISTVTLNDFWASVNGGGGATAGTFDPKIIYDHDDDRFIFVAMDDSGSASSGILIGVTATSDPTAIWYLWKIDADASNTDWADFPSPGFNSKWIALSANMFTIAGNSFTETKMWVIDKARAYTNDLNIIDVFDNTDFSGGFTIAPCKTFGSEPNLYTVDSGWYSGSDDYVRHGRIIGAVNSPAWGNLGYVNVPDSDVPGDAPQLGGGQLIDNGDSRISSPPVFRHGNIYFNYTGKLSSPTRHVIIWGEYNASSGAAINMGIVQEASIPMYYAYPSIAVNSHTSIVMGFSGFSTGIYASAYYTGREFTNAANVMQGVKLLKAGEDYYFKDFGSGRNRWGDYSATCVDPADDTKFWTIQEYAMTDVGGGVNDDRWGTWWGKIYFVPEPGLFLILNFGALILFIIKRRASSV